MRPTESIGDENNWLYPELDWDNFSWHHFSGFTRSQRARPLRKWMWSHGYDLEESETSKRIWVCFYCARKKNPNPPQHYVEGAIQHARVHLWIEHSIWNSEETAEKPKKAGRQPDNRAQGNRNIAQYMKLNTHNPREQAIANQLVGAFDRNVFQQKLVAWIIKRNHAFRIAEEEELCELFVYCNPFVLTTEANISRTTVHNRIVSTYEEKMPQIIEQLAKVQGKIHCAFDGWRSGNRLPLYGVVIFFLDEFACPQKLVLDIPEIKQRHTGENLAKYVFAVLEKFGIENKMGYFTLDNAGKSPESRLGNLTIKRLICIIGNNDTAMEHLGELLGFDGKAHFVRCFGHIVNLVAGALLFGANHSGFEELVGSDLTDAITKHKEWQKRGPIGKLVTLLVALRRSDPLINRLLEKQQAAFDASDNAEARAKTPLGVVIYAATRWLSMLSVIRRALQLRPYITDLWEEENASWRREAKRFRESKRSKKKEPNWPLVFRDDAELTDEDWKIITATGEVLEDLEDALMKLQGDGKPRLRKDGFVEAYGSMWDYAIAFEFLLERLETWRGLADLFAHPVHFANNINHAWEKLDEYYRKLSETPVYYAAVALHPAYRWQFFEETWEGKPQWIYDAKAAVQKVWDNEYNQTNREAQAAEPAQKKRRFKSRFGQYRESHRSRAPSTPLSDLDDAASSSLSGPTSSSQQNGPLNEYERWQADRGEADEFVTNPFEYWHERRKLYPRLSQMALDFLSVAPMSAEVERLFSSAGRMVTNERGHLDAKVVALCQCLRSWAREKLIQLAPENLASFPQESAKDSLVYTKQSADTLYSLGLGLADAMIFRDESGKVVGRLDLLDIDN